VLRETPLCVELHSVFTGHAYIESHATHLLIGPLGYASRRINRDHVRESVDPVLKPRACVLEHTLQLIVPSDSASAGSASSSCISRSAHARPAGPPPTITTSTSMRSPSGAVDSDTNSPTGSTGGG
jgi:hypothetical protein